MSFACSKELCEAEILHIMKKLDEKNLESDTKTIITGVPLNKATDICKCLNDVKMGYAIPFTIVKAMTGN